MRIASFCTVALAAAVLAPEADARQRAKQERSSANFAKPVRLMAGEKSLGAGRYYPSPVFHDMNGDGRLDVVVGDLMGRMTVALRLEGDGAPRYGGETPLKAADGNDLKFHNW